MKAADIAQTYLDYFEKNGHAVVPSASLLSQTSAATIVSAPSPVAGTAPLTSPRSSRTAQKSFGAADIAESIRVRVLNHFTDELRAVFAEPGERLVEVRHLSRDVGGHGHCDAGAGEEVGQRGGGRPILRRLFEAAVDEVAEKLGGFDVLVNNAGIAQIKQLMEITEEDLPRSPPPTANRSSSPRC